MNIELEFDFDDPVFGVLHGGEHEPEIVAGTVSYVTVDKDGVYYSVAETGTDFVMDFAAVDVTSDYCVALALQSNYMKQYRKDSRKYLEEQIAITESNLERYRAALKDLEKQ